jgi:Protein of unknown function (DUF2958)
MAQSLIPEHFRKLLLANAARSAAAKDFDPVPVVKLFTPDANGTWLLTELDPDQPDIALGLCDLGFGGPKLGSVSPNELTHVRGPLGLLIERDERYAETRPLSVLTKLARKAGRI